MSSTATWDDFEVLTPELGERIGELLAGTGTKEVSETVGTVIIEQNWDAGSGDTPEQEAVNKGTALTFADEAIRAIKDGLIVPGASAAVPQAKDYGSSDLADLLAEDAAQAEPEDAAAEADAEG